MAVTYNLYNTFGTRLSKNIDSQSVAEFQSNLSKLIILIGEKIESHYLLKSLLIFSRVSKFFVIRGWQVCKHTF